MTAESKTSNRMDWLIFFLSTVIFFLMIFFVPSFFWVALPFVCTYFVKAMNWM